MRPHWREREHHPLEQCPDDDGVRQHVMEFTRPGLEVDYFLIQQPVLGLQERKALRRRQILIRRCVIWPNSIYHALS